MGKEISSVFLPYVSVIISSNINEVIRAVLNPLFFFLQKDFARTKSTKKHKNATKQKHNNANKQTKIKTVLKGKKVTYSFICVFALFVRVKKIK